MNEWRRARRAGALGAITLVLASGAGILVASSGTPVRVELAGSPAGTIGRPLHFVFDTRLSTSGVTQALVYRDRGYRFSDFDQIWNYNISSAYEIRGTAQS